MRESPSLAITQALRGQLPGRLMVVEPNIEALPASLEGTNLATLDAALAEADVIVLLVDHRAFKKIGPERLAERYLVDTRGLWTGQTEQNKDRLLA